MRFATQKFASIGEKTNSKNGLQCKAENEMGRDISVTKPEEQKRQKLEVRWLGCDCKVVKKCE